MDMKERLQELAEAARKRIEESDGPDKLNEVKEFDIISICDTIRIAMFDEPYPYIVPVNFGEEIIGD